MDNRFTIKDAVLFLLIVAIIVMLWLKMVQDDRLWEQSRQILTEVQTQTRDIAALRRVMNEGGVSVNAGTVEAPPANDAFRRIRMARQKPGYAEGDWMVESVGMAVPVLNPLTSQDVYASIVQGRVIESLAVTDVETLELVPLLAQSWQIADDGLSTTFKLRPNVTFSDGQPMTAEDVAYTFDLIMDKDVTDGRVREYLRHIERVEVLGTHEVKFHYRAVFYENFRRSAEFQVLPKHFLSKFSKQELREHKALLMGTGPYRLADPEQYTPGQQIELMRNERYWGVAGPWDRIIWRIIERESTELVAFRNGEIDTFGPTPEQHVEMIKDADLLKRKEYLEFESVRTGYSYIGWNQKRQGLPTLFADKRVRQAMTMLVDRRRMIDEILLGYATVASGPFHHLGPQYDTAIEPWPYDPQRALELLREVGFSREGDGPLLGPDGKPFEFELIYPAGSELIQRIGLFLRDNFARAGINLKLNPQDWALLLQSLNARDFEAITLGWSGDVEVDIEQMFHTRCIEDGDNPNSNTNPEFDAANDKAHVALDAEERMALWRQCHRILHEDQPYTFLMRAKGRLWHDNRMENVQPMPTLGVNYVSTWPMPIEWYVPADRQLRDNEP